MVNDTTLPRDNPSDLDKIFHKEIYNKSMTIDGQIEDEKLQYDINREAAKVSALSSEKLTSMNILLVKKYCFLIKNK